MQTLTPKNVVPQIKQIAAKLNQMDKDFMRRKSIPLREGFVGDVFERL